MSLLNVGARAVQTNQAALQVTGHNIANVNTAGYSRQTVSLRTEPGQLKAGGYIGNGVAVEAVLRNHSDLLTRQASAAAAVDAGDTARLDRLKQLQEVFSGGKNGLGSAINDMMNAFSDVVSSPTDMTARGVVLTRIDETARRVREASSSMNEISQVVDDQVNSDVVQVNNLTKQIASLNGDIVFAQGKGQPPNDLLDQRDQLIRQVNQYVQTSQVAADDGSITLFVASSQPLVMGNTAATLSIGEPQDFNTNGAQKKLIFTAPGSSQSIELNDSMLGGGEISGLLRFQNGDLTEGRNLLGRMATTISETLNAQNKRGLTLDGNVGDNLFKPVSLGNAVQGKNNVAPLVVMGLEVTDVSKLQASNYDVTFSGGASGTVTRQSDGKTFGFVNLTELGDYFTAQGLKLTDGNTPSAAFSTTAGANAGDKFLINPLQDAARQMEAAEFSPRQLAAANPINAKMGAANDGSLQLASLKVTGLDATGQPATFVVPPIAGNGVKIEFSISATSGKTIYTTTGATTDIVASDEKVYVPGQPIRIDGWEITLNGLPKAYLATDLLHKGDTVTVDNALDPQYGTYYQRDSGNASALMGLRDAKLFDGAALTDGFAGAMSQVGTRTQSAQFAAKLSSAIASNLDQERAAVSGVNLDEEAARLIQYQQAYQASAKMIQIAQGIFDSLIQSVGR
ncbi:MAG: flagellar hook-associated protein FlgK [Burkholderiaceae bacterium]|nr:flagellar hook-associated protein FlgK [Burkholderiaceae bacterium]